MNTAPVWAWPLAWPAMSSLVLWIHELFLSLTPLADLLDGSLNFLRDTTLAGKKKGKTLATGHLPRDVWWDIFILLPARSLVPLRAVCKTWRSVIDDPFFHRAHKISSHNHITILILTSSTAPPFAPYYSFDLNALIPTLPLQTIPATPACLPPAGPPHLVLATCHGLIYENFEIWNPLFGERLELPLFGDPRKVVGEGIGYDHATDDYKAVVIVFDNAFRTYVYSLRSDSWRRIGDCPCAVPDDLGGPGFYLGGTLHWMSLWDCDIFALDLETEEYRKLKPPPFWECPRKVKQRQRQLHVLGGCLVVTDYCKDVYYHVNFDAWVLEEREGGGGGSWIKLFSLRHNYGKHQISYTLRPVAYMKDKRHVFMQDFKNFYLVDAERNELKRVNIRGLTSVDILISQLFQETLFRPKYMCGVVGGQGRKKMSSSRHKRKIRMMEKCNTELCFTISDVHLGKKGLL